jgi:hypothetical protein
MMHVKINDYLEFPEQIDFTPWTMAGLSGQDNSSSDISHDDIGRFSENEAISEANISNELEKDLL